MSYGEFDLIKDYFNRTARPRADVDLGIGDDCAILNPQKHRLAISTDTLVAGVHFLPNIDPTDLAYKALAVNLSDLAAMGATPAWLTLALTLPKVEQEWLKRFSDSLFAQIDHYGMQLVGGDTTQGPLAITLTVIGFTASDNFLSRSGARLGDDLYVTGTLGDSAAGLALLQSTFPFIQEKQHAYFVERHLRPTARIAQGLALRGIATAAIDISDGLVSDLKHILKASGCGAHLHLNLLPFSGVMCQLNDQQQCVAWALFGGEDYELCFTAPPKARTTLSSLAQLSGVPITRIGKIESAPNELVLLRHGERVYYDRKGYDHFDQ